MSKIIYVKQSNERSRELSIITKIYKHDDGKRYVTKSAAFSESVPHIKKMRKAYDLLCEKYSKYDVEINKCKTIDESTVEFEYIASTTLENVVDELIKEKKISEAKKIILDYIEIIRKANQQTEFVVTEDFGKVFGEDIDWNEKSFSGIITDIDRVLGNVFMRDGKYIFVDYEWTFEFPIPVEYTIYRIVHYYLATDVKRSEVINQIDFLHEIGLSDKTIEKCRKMELGFQKYVIGNMVPINNMRDDLLKGSTDVKSLVSINEVRQQIKMYFNNGNGLCEEDTAFFRANMINGRLAFEYMFEREYEGIRVDLTETRSIIVLHKICIDDKNLIELNDFYSNGVKICESAYLFDDGDPYFGFNSKINKDSKLTLEYSIITSNENDNYFDMKTIITSLINNISENKKKIDECNAKIEECNVKIDEDNAIIDKCNNHIVFLENEITKYQNSFSWKITKPIRKVGSILKSGGK